MMIHLIETPPGLMHRYGCPKAAAADSITRWVLPDGTVFEFDTALCPECWTVEAAVLFRMGVLNEQDTDYETAAYETVDAISGHNPSGSRFSFQALRPGKPADQPEWVHVSGVKHPNGIITYWENGQ